jgi:ParB family chromosome partitioning protein
MARDLAAASPLPEKDYALEFEEPALLTLGVCYEKNGRFPGGAYHPILKRVDGFFEEKLPKALEKREERAGAGDRASRGRLRGDQGAAGEGIPEPLPARVRRGEDQPPFSTGAKASFDETLEKMIAPAKKFKPDSVKADQLARASGPPDE